MGKKKIKGPVSMPATLAELVAKCDAAYEYMQARYADLVNAGTITVSDDNPDGDPGTKKFVDSNVKFIRTVDEIADFIAAMNCDDACGVCSRDGSADTCGDCVLRQGRTMNRIYFEPKDHWED